MAAHNWNARIRLPSAGLYLARTRSPATLYRHDSTGETCSASSAELLICLGNEPAQDIRGNPPVRSALERTVRRMKKTLITILQLTVTVGLLYWVFHDPSVRAAMALGMREADYRWIAAAILAYIIVEVGAVVRWHILLKVQGISLSAARVGGLFLIG